MSITQANVDDLATFVASNVGSSQRLIELTNYDDPTATTVNTSYLGLICRRAILWFRAEFNDYNGDTTDLDNDDPMFAYYKVMALLYAETDDREKAAEFEEQLKPLNQKKRAARTVSPYTTSQVSWASDASSGTKVAFHDDYFNGTQPDIPGGRSSD